MKFLGSKTLETKRLLLHKTEEKDLKVLWQILLNKDISKYYLTSKINNSWEEEEKWQYKKLERASDNDVFTWTIELKDTHEVIGQISVQESTSSRKDIRDIGWFIDTQYQRKGYAYEAALEVLKYMFLEVEIKEINTSSAIVNDASWKLMEKLGFKRQKTTHMEKYTFLDNPIEVYEYIGTKKDFLKEYFRKESLYITEDIDKEPYMKHLSDDPVINITGESGSGKTTMIEDYKDLDAIIIDTDKIYKDSSQEVKHYLQEKYGYLPDICKESAPFNFFLNNSFESKKCVLKIIQLNDKNIICLECKGTGSSNPNENTTCLKCKGFGSYIKINNINHFILQSRTILKKNIKNAKGKKFKILKEKLKLIYKKDSLINIDMKCLMKEMKFLEKKQDI